MDNLENTELEKPIVIGDFKPKRKYLNFVSAVAGRRVRFLRDSATINGSRLSGILDGTQFKLTICDEGTVNFEEIDTNKSDKDMRKRLLDDIDDTPAVGYAEKFIVSGYEFRDIDNNLCYLEVEHTKPIDKLRGLLEKKEEPVLSEKGLSILDSLFGAYESDEVEVNDEVEEIEEEIEIETEKVDETISYMEEQFRKMNEEKVNELKKRIEDSERDIIRYKSESKSALKNAEEVESKLEVLNSRLESLTPGEDPNGYAFFVSEEQKSMDELDDTGKEIASKIADIMGIKQKETLFKHLTESFYKISIANKNDFNDKKIPNDVLTKLKFLNLTNGTISVKGDGEFEYRGNLNWHQLTSKMIRAGFEQVPDFDKVAGSNSYTVTSGPTKDTDGEFVLISAPYSNTNTNSSQQTIDPNNCEEDDEKEKSKEFVQKELVSFTEPTDIVLIGDGDGSGFASFSVDDDESGYDIYVGGKEVDSASCFGFGQIITLSEYKQWLINQKNNPDYDEYHLEIMSAHIILGFTGEIGISAKLTEYNLFSDDFDIDDYIHHQFESAVDVVINFPDGTDIHEIKNHDLNSVRQYLRNESLEKLGI